MSQDSVRKYLAPEGALRLGVAFIPAGYAVDGQKAPSTRRPIHWELPCGGCQQRRTTASPTASPLNRPSESPRTTPPPRAPSSSTTTKASTPSGFVPGELAGIQETSRSALPQEPVKQTQTKASVPEKLGIRPLMPTRHPPTSGQAVMRPGGRADSPAKPPRPRFRSGAGAGR